MTSALAADLHAVVHTLAHPGSPVESRLAAIQFLEKLDGSPAATVLAAARQCMDGEKDATIQVSLLDVMQKAITTRWEELDEALRSEVVAFLWTSTLDIWTYGLPQPLQFKSAQVLVCAVERSGPAVLADFLKQLQQIIAAGGNEREGMVCRVVLFLAEDITNYSGQQSRPRHPGLLAELTNASHTLLGVLGGVLERNIADAERLSMQERGRAEVEAHMRVAQVALQATGAVAAFAPLERLHSGVVDIMGTLLRVRQLQPQALQLLSGLLHPPPDPVRSPASVETYRQVMLQVGRVVVDTARSIVAAQEQPAAAEEAVQQFAEQFTSTMAAFGKKHLAWVQDEEVVLQFLVVAVKLWSGASNQVAAPLCPMFSFMARKCRVQNPDAHLGKVLAGILASQPQFWRAVMAGAAQQIVEMSTHLHVGTPDGAAAGAAADDDLPEGFDNMRACRLWLSGFKGETTTLVTLCASIDPRDALDLAKELVAHSGLAIGGGAEGAGEVASAWAKGEAVISFLEACRLAWESLAPEDVLLHEVRTLLASLLVSGGGAATVGQRARAVRQLITACTCRAAGAAAGWRDDAVLVWAQQQLELGSSVPHTNARQLRGLRKTLMQVFVALAADSPAVLVCRVQAIMDWGWALCQKGVLLQDEYATVIEALIKACKSSSDTDQAALVQHILTFLQPTWQMENSHLNSIEAFVAHYILPRLEQAPVAEGGLQTNGRAAFAAADVRLRLHMQVQLVTAAVSTASSNAAAQAVLAEALAWVVPGILALICCLHAMWRPDVRSQLSSKAPALYAMSAAEWTTYAGRPDEAPSCRHADLSGDSVDDVRLWMEIILHMAYHAVVEIAQLPVQVDWQPAAWLQGERLSDMGHKQLKLYLRQCLLPLVRFGHPATVKELVLPLVSEMLKSLPGILLRGPQPQQQPSQLAESGAAAGGGSATGAEVVSESLMRELARAALCIVSTLVGSPHTPARVLSTTGDGRASSTATQPRTSLPDGAAAGPFPGAEPWATTPAAGSVAGDARGAGDGGSGNGQGSGGGVRIVKAGEEGGLSLAMLLQQDAEAARNGVDLAVLGLELPDGECLRYATGVCEELIRGEGAAAAVLAQIRAPFVVPRVLNGILKALAAAHASPTEQADMIRISTTIFQQQWPTARGVLVSLGIEPEMVDRLRAALDATPSLKQQRTVVKQFFAQACSIALPASGSSASLAGPQQATVPEPSRKPVFVQPPGGADEAGAGHGVRALFP